MTIDICRTRSRLFERVGKVIRSGDSEGDLCFRQCDRVCGRSFNVSWSGITWSWPSSPYTHDGMWTR